MNNAHAYPRVGIGVFVFRDGTFLMGKRLGAHGEGSWSIPGGHFEFGETFEDTAVREVLEETGVQIQNVRFAAITNDMFKADDRHYVTIWMMSEYVSGEAEIREPDKFVDQAWFTFDNLPSPLFLPWNQLLRSFFIENIKSELGYSK